jgi:hypothetical protein
MNKMIPLLQQKLPKKKQLYSFFYVFNFNQIDKMEPPFGMQVCKIQNANTILRKDAQNKVSVSNGIKLRTLQKPKINYILSPLIPKVTSDFVFTFKKTQQPLHKIQSQERRKICERKALILRI